MKFATLNRKQITTVKESHKLVIKYVQGKHRNLTKGKGRGGEDTNCRLIEKNGKWNKTFGAFENNYLTLQPSFPLL